ncbi:MFS transporter [Snodgrassella gandavensis]|uniref:MFS transporter n=1 Tax=Snodgrassella gandavensis TaxID=2946698 RepID=UPI001EF535F9|nr:MFS transporter [Snodgrassella gandavensis]
MHTRQFLSLYGSIFFLFSGYGLILNSAGVKPSQMGVSNITIGILNAAFFVGGTISAIVSHRIISRVGHIRSFSVFGALFAIAALAHLMVEQLWMWGILRAVLGFSHYSLLMVVESWFTARSVPQTRAKILALYEVVYYVSSATSVLLLSLNMSSNNIFTLAAILVIAATLPVGLTRMQQPEIPKRERISLPHVLSIVPLAWLACFMAGIFINGFFTMGSVFILKLGYSLPKVSLFLGSAMIGGFTIQLFIAWLSNKFGRPRIIFGCACVAAVAAFCGMLLLLVMPGNIWAQCVIALAIGCSGFPLYALGLARANDVLPANMNTVEVNRCLLFVYGLGSLVAPLLLGAVMQLFNHYGFYSVYAIIATVLAVYTFMQPAVPISERSVYVPVSGNVGPITPELDPRNNDATDTPYDADSAEQHVQATLQNTEKQQQADN